MENVGSFRISGPNNETATKNNEVGKISRKKIELLTKCTEVHFTHTHTTTLTPANPARYNVQGTRNKVQGTRYKVQGTRYKVQGTRYKVQGIR